MPTRRLLKAIIVTTLCLAAGLLALASVACALLAILALVFSATQLTGPDLAVGGFASVGVAACGSGLASAALKLLGAVERMQ